MQCILWYGLWGISVLWNCSAVYGTVSVMTGPSLKIKRTGHVGAFFCMFLKKFLRCNAPCSLFPLKKLAAVDGVLANEVHQCQASASAKQPTAVPPTTHSSSVCERELTAHMTNGTSEDTDPIMGSSNGKGQDEWSGLESSLTVTNGKTFTMEMPETSLMVKAESPTRSSTTLE